MVAKRKNAFVVKKTLLISLFFLKIKREKQNVFLLRSFRDIISAYLVYVNLFFRKKSKIFFGFCKILIFFVAIVFCFC